MGRCQGTLDGLGSIFVANHALLSALPGDMVVLRVFVDDRGTRLFEPGDDE